jgi:hypothetical protein
VLAASALSVEKAAEIIQEFEDELNRIFSVYLDADHGFTEISKMMASLKILTTTKSVTERTMTRCLHDQ